MNATVETVAGEITSTPGTRGGRPCIAGTGVTVQRVVGWHRLGYSAEEIARLIGHLTIWDVYSALAYYHAHHSEIDRLLTQEDADYERLADEAGSHTRAKP
jgi:uncharacterized protein (DUF433 family)